MKMNFKLHCFVASILSICNLFLIVIIASFSPKTGFAIGYDPKKQKTGTFANFQKSFNSLDPVGRMLKTEIALKVDREKLPRPKVGLIPSDEIRCYPYVNRYLTELDDKNISHYYILHEDYEFQNLFGKSFTIRAGFIWDGASIPHNVFVSGGLDVGNTRYNSALAEGLIHDFMYRDPRRFSRDEADDLLYVNLVRCGNANPMMIYSVVRTLGESSYRGHKKRQEQGLYDVFTDKFYDGNTTIYQSCRITREPQLFDLDPERKKDDSVEEKVCRDYKPTSADKPASGGKAGTVDARRKKKENDDEDKVNDVANVEVKQVNDVDTGKVGSSAGIGIKGWCSCGSGSDSEGRGARSITVGVGLMNCPKSLPRYSYQFCLRCGKCRRPNLKFDMRVIVDNQLEMQIFATKALEKGLLTTSGYVNARKDVERKFINIPDGQIVFPGKCTCKDSDPIQDGFMNNYVCVVCGRCYVPVNNTVPLGPTARREYGLK